MPDIGEKVKGLSPTGFRAGPGAKFCFCLGPSWVWVQIFIFLRIRVRVRNHKNVDLQHPTCFISNIVVFYIDIYHFISFEEFFLRALNKITKLNVKKFNCTVKWKKIVFYHDTLLLVLLILPYFSLDVPYIDLSSWFNQHVNVSYFSPKLIKYMGNFIC